MALEASSGNSAPTVGSGTWTGNQDYDCDGELYSRTESFLKNIDWTALAAHASKHRSGILCKIQQSFSAGHFNMVRRIMFADGVSWIARLRLPELATFFGNREALDVDHAMRIEIATMRYIR